MNKERVLRYIDNEWPELKSHKLSDADLETIEKTLGYAKWEATTSLYDLFSEIRDEASRITKKILVNKPKKGNGG